MGAKRYVVMAARHGYGSFIFRSGGSAERPETLGLSWAEGRSGLEAATKFASREIARFVIEQISAVEGPITVEEIDAAGRR